MFDDWELCEMLRKFPSSSISCLLSGSFGSGSGCRSLSSVSCRRMSNRYKSSCIEAMTSVPRQKKIARASPRSRLGYFTQVTANKGVPTHSSREKFYGVKAEFSVMENVGSC